MSLNLVYQYLVSAPFVHGAQTTLLISLSSLFLGVAIGLVVAVLQDSGGRIGQVLTLGYLWIFRGTPVLFQIIFVYNVLPSFGIRLSGFVCAVLALSLNEGAYMAEILRSGLRSVRRGQRTAGLALGLTGWQVMRRVVIPQAARVVLPPIGNQAIGMLKLSALVSAIAVEELLLVANQVASADFRYFEALTAAGIYYLAMTTVFMAFQSALERWLEPKNRRRGARASMMDRFLGITGRQTVR
jgi:polar amino acid transport system permease protein